MKLLQKRLSLDGHISCAPLVPMFLAQIKANRVLKVLKHRTGEPSFNLIVSETRHA
jgi:hypothetical protein